MSTYNQRLKALTAERGNLCVGIDPHASLLSAWGLPLTAAGLERYCRTIIDALGETVAVFKPQSAFFEVYGSAGIAVLETVIAEIRAAGALSIIDAKRGDIGSTMSAYAEAYLAPDSPLAGDAVTLSPYLGFESLMPAFERAIAFDRGVYVLARTSNPEGGSVQLALGREGSVVQEIIDAAKELNSRARTRAIGLVVGGTHGTLACDVSEFNASILVPGIGAQGGRLEDLPELFGPAFDKVLPMVGRGILQAGPDSEALRAKAKSYAAV
ncbi:orotidine-5'-phosphate decarboxylase [Propioniciclava coleopterorum]|uniref:Orotidine-5'-phosphate decarboxylase n=1 Tax=Propioniciclava coleopterorum TaxID=2714937 RepID=A0A6G7Y9Q7_9ACTN|nr:orotidine-5'-phosphate decarboxylase [Propioniciclava coleopterorum]QIK73552.1 orotidine-5'-phosphate decarboxylase [Propioniciclava coleopterorum]